MLLENLQPMVIESFKNSFIAVAEEKDDLSDSSVLPLIVHDINEDMMAIITSTQKKESEDMVLVSTFEYKETPIYIYLAPRNN